jgi:hypothetical protein
MSIGRLYQNETPGAYIVTPAGRPVESPDILTVELAAELREMGRRLGKLEGVRSARQWALAARVNREWDDLEREYKAERVTHSMYLAACSSWLNTCAGMPLLTPTGETLRRWCDLGRQFADPAFDPYKAALPIEHFRVARAAYLAGEVASPLEALDRAVSERLTAEELGAVYRDPPEGGWGYVEFSKRLRQLRAGLDWASDADKTYILSRMDEIEARLARVTEWQAQA